MQSEQPYKYEKAGPWEGTPDFREGDKVELNPETNNKSTYGAYRLSKPATIFELVEEINGVQKAESYATLATDQMDESWHGQLLKRVPTYLLKHSESK